ncbi:MAG: carboxypeptidase-like regulatory domain-containing protein, partial [Formivibrio sp.]|nr:carboxypeptidase-like regulatory domain-containing protein [Formivibrio sp.]
MLILLVCIVLLGPSRAFAQEFRGTISGSVTDPSGAVVPGASIGIREVNTGTINQTVSDNAGQ